MATVSLSKPKQSLALASGVRAAPMAMWHVHWQMPPRRRHCSALGLRAAATPAAPAKGVRHRAPSRDHLSVQRSHCGLRMAARRVTATCHSLPPSLPPSLLYAVLRVPPSFTFRAPSGRVWAFPAREVMPHAYALPLIRGEQGAGGRGCGGGEDG